MRDMDKRRASNRAWWLANKEQARIASDKWRAGHVEEVKAAVRARYIPRQDYARNREWRLKNKEYNNERARKWQNTPERRRLARARTRAWQKAYPDKVRAASLRYGHRACMAPGVATAEHIAARIAYFGGVCSYCGGPYEHLDHAISLFRGGTNWPANLRPACAQCNLSKGAKTIFEFLTQGRV